ncbi:MAG: hypothetical protein EZS28_041473, partial [Streblomastix strix]
MIQALRELLQMSIVRVQEYLLCLLTTRSKTGFLTFDVYLAMRHRKFKWKTIAALRGALPLISTEMFASKRASDKNHVIRISEPLLKRRIVAKLFR